MKKYFYLLLFIFQSLAVAAQWEWSNPKPSGYLNTKIVFTDAQTGWIINANGDLIRTLDQGQSWMVQKNLPTAITIDYKDSTAIIGGANRVYLSTDFGNSWVRKDLNINKLVDKAQVISRDTIFVVGTDQSISSTTMLESTDRGLNWQEKNTGFNIRSFWMVNSNIGYATSSSGIFKTTNGGQSWQQLVSNSTSSLFTYVKFRDKDTGFIFRESYQILKTTDGGQNWAVSTGLIGSQVLDMYFVDASTIMAVGIDGIMLRSTDNGNSWSALPNGLIDANSLYSVHFTDPSTGFAVGHRGRILKTMDGGLSWNKYAPTYIDVDAMDFITGSTGYAATWNNVYKSTDAGNSWIPLSLTTPGNFDRFRSIHFFSLDTGIAFSESPLRISKTYDGGANWQTINTGIPYNDNILGSYYLDHTIYLSTNGAYGYKILRSGDAGETWTVQNLSSGFGMPSYNSPFFVSQETGYSVNGYNVYKSTDSGKNWTSLPIAANQLLRNVWFTSASTGYVSGDQSFMAKTSDSGHSWHQIYIDPTNVYVPGDLKNLVFFNHKIGFVTSGRSVYRTVTAGDSWKELEPVAWNINGLEIAPDTSLYSFGIYGSIEKRSLRAWETDSLSADSLWSCSARVSARITAVLASVDSVWFQYGTSGYTSELAATPSSITDTSRKVIASLPGLLEHTTYRARLKLFYEGGYHYSDSILFETGTESTPVITLNGAYLHSSSPNGNQWYINGSPIAGANQQDHFPVQSGSYTVRTLTGGCTSPFSLPYTYYIVSVNDPADDGSIKIFPNPATTDLYISNDQMKKVRISILGNTGTELLSMYTSGKDNHMDLHSLPSGTYLVMVRDVRSSKTYKRLIVKL